MMIAADYPEMPQEVYLRLTPEERLLWRIPKELLQHPELLELAQRLLLQLGLSQYATGMVVVVLHALNQAVDLGRQSEPEASFAASNEPEGRASGLPEGVYSGAGTLEDANTTRGSRHARASIYTPRIPHAAGDEP